MSRISIPSWVVQWAAGVAVSVLVSLSAWTLREVVAIRLEIAEAEATRTAQIDFLYQQGADHEDRIRVLERERP